MMSIPDEREKTGEESNERWLKRLGEPADSTTEPTDEDEREADQLRGAILRASKPALISDEDYHAARGTRDEMLREQILSTARREGLFGRSRLSTWAWPSGFGLAAALLLGIALFGHQKDEHIYPVEPVLRGAPTDVQTVLSKSPRTQAESLAATLKSAGANVQIYQHGNIYTLDIVIVPENAEAVTAALKGQGLEAMNGSVRIQIKMP
jgi:hypothetical protein